MDKVGIFSRKDFYPQYIPEFNIYQEDLDREGHNSVIIPFEGTETVDQIRAMHIDKLGDCTDFICIGPRYPIPYNGQSFPDGHYEIQGRLIDASQWYVSVSKKWGILLGTGNQVVDPYIDVLPGASIAAVDFEGYTDPGYFGPYLPDKQKCYRNWFNKRHQLSINGTSKYINQVIMANHLNYGDLAVIGNHTKQQVARTKTPLNDVPVSPVPDDGFWKGITTPTRFRVDYSGGSQFGGLVYIGDLPRFLSIKPPTLYSVIFGSLAVSYEWERCNTRGYLMGEEVTTAYNCWGVLPLDLFINGEADFGEMARQSVQMSVPFQIFCNSYMSVWGCPKVRYTMGDQPVIPPIIEPPTPIDPPASGSTTINIYMLNKR